MKVSLWVLSMIFIISCTTVPLEKQCTTTADCVPAACCHATEAVNQQSAPDCSDIFCTAVCEPGTLDCGQGEIQCIAGECQVALKEE